MYSSEQSNDYDLVRRTIEFISGHWLDHPSLDEIAGNVGASADTVQRSFTRWAGLTPKSFMQALTIDHARQLLQQSATVLDTAYEVGLSGSGRLHDLFVTHEGMPPGIYRAKGAGLEITWGLHQSPFGIAVVLTTPHGLAGLAFADQGGEMVAFEDMARRWPNAEFIRDDGATFAMAKRIFDRNEWQADQPLRVVMIGTDFEVRVWETLLRIPMGAATTYSAVAEKIGKPKAVRAVGTAVGKNPISFVVPCHRVLGKSGNLCGYHWGLTRKKAILGWEAGTSQT
ncbi:MAG: bifunctional helix-turn-helix domain-containing protein/methylated-DNA--[protein]-cysteine S-methyltransferase [Anderseniella sp.]